jgi:hypothetical protein
LDKKKSGSEVAVGRYEVEGERGAKVGRREDVK